MCFFLFLPLSLLGHVSVYLCIFQSSNLRKYTPCCGCPWFIIRLTVCLFCQWCQRWWNSVLLNKQLCSPEEQFHTGESLKNEECCMKVKVWVPLWSQNLQLNLQGIRWVADGDCQCMLRIRTDVWSTEVAEVKLDLPVSHSNKNCFICYRKPRRNMTKRQRSIAQCWRSTLASQQGRKRHIYMR